MAVCVVNTIRLFFAFASLVIVGSCASQTNVPSDLNLDHLHIKQDVIWVAVESAETNAGKVNPVERKLSDGSNDYVYGNACRKHVDLVFDVDAQGNPENARVAISSGSRKFDHDAVRAVNEWKYEPRISDEPDSFRKNLMTRMTTELGGCDVG